MRRQSGGIPAILVAALGFAMAQHAPSMMNAQESHPADTSHCQALSTGDARSNLLPSVCNFALTYRQNLPDFICEQKITTTGPPATISKAEVTFEKGHEHYSKVTIDGRAPSKATTASEVSFLSAGELGSDLVDLFKPPIVAEFRFHKESNLHRIPSAVYDFHLAREKNTFWALRDGGGTTLHPGYEGELWLESKTGKILRLQLRAMHLPPTFGFATADVTIDYSDVPISKLGSFRLPFKSETAICSFVDSLVPCRKNTVVFHGCRKFSATTRVITDRPTQ